MGIFLALISAVSLAVCFFIQKLSVNKKQNPLIMAFLFQLFGSFFAILFLIGNKFYFTGNLVNIIFLIISGFFWSLVNFFNFKAYQLLEVSIAGILGQLTLVISFIGSLIIFSESANIIKIAGAVAVLLGNIILFIKGKGNKEVNLKGVFFRIAGAVSMGLALLIDAKDSASFSVPFYVACTYFFGSIFIIIYTRMNLQEVKQHFKNNSKLTLSSSFLGAFSYMALIGSFAYIEKSVALTISNLSAIFLVILGIIFLRERKSLAKKILATALVFLGAVLLSQA